MRVDYCAGTCEKCRDHRSAGKDRNRREGSDRQGPTGTSIGGYVMFPVLCLLLRSHIKCSQRLIKQQLSFWYYRSVLLRGTHCVECFSEFSSTMSGNEQHCHLGLPFPKDSTEFHSSLVQQSDMPFLCMQRLPSWNSAAVLGEACKSHDAFPTLRRRSTTQKRARSGNWSCTQQP